MLALQWYNIQNWWLRVKLHATLKKLIPTKHGRPTRNKHVKLRKNRYST